MSEDEDNFLRRWSRLKHQNESAQAPAESPKPTLPAVDQLTPESDFSPFMHPKVEDALRRVALKTLFRDPHFSAADPFEPFSGDWTVGEPIPQEMLATLNQAQQHLFSDKKKEKEEAGAQPASTEQQPQPDIKTDEPGKQDA